MFAAMTVSRVEPTAASARQAAARRYGPTSRKFMTAKGRKAAAKLRSPRASSTASPIA